MKALTWVLYLFFLLQNVSLVTAQSLTLTGTVMDASTGEPIPFANVYCLENGLGTAADPEGKFVVKLPAAASKLTLIASYIGYRSDTVHLEPGRTFIQFSLQPEVVNLQEVAVTAGENQAYAIIRQAVKHKQKNTPHILRDVQYQSYNRTEIFVGNLQALKNSKLIKEVNQLMEGHKKFKDKKGRPIIPISITETIARVSGGIAHASDRQVVHTRTNGVGLDAEDGITQILTSNTDKEYNFYQNHIQLLDKLVASPITDDWRFNYEYWLIDSIQVGKEWCYEIDVEPRHKTDVAFTGKIWITQKEYALKKLSLRITEQANLNYVKTFAIRQESRKVAGGAWFPVEHAVSMELSDFSPQFPALLLNIAHKNNHVSVSSAQQQTPDNAVPDVQPIPDFQETVALPEIGDSISVDDMYQMIDSIKQIPRVKTYSAIGQVISDGYYKIGKVDVGHYLYTYAWNNIEGHRIGTGLRTNRDLSKSGWLEGWAAYGTQDRRFKYSVSAQYLINPRTFTTFGIRRTEDIEPLAQITHKSDIHMQFKVFNRWLNIKRLNPFFYRENVAWLESDLSPILSGRLSFRNLSLQTMIPVAKADSDASVRADMPFHTSELELHLRFGRNENTIRTKANRRKRIGSEQVPIITLTGILGIKGVANSEFNYQKVLLSIWQKQLPMLGIGTAEYNVSAGYIFSNLPYPLLKVHQGNGTPFLFKNASQGMRDFEFISDHFVEVHYTYYFSDAFTNRVPGFNLLSRHLGWRFFGGTNAVWGGMRLENQTYNASLYANDDQLPAFQTLAKKPYVDVVYGVENIFRVLRVDLVHRLTYLDNPGVRPFCVKFSAKFRF